MFFPIVPQHIHDALSTSKSKLSFYQCDFYYEKSLAIAYSVLKEQLPRIMLNTALLIIKPDADMMGRIPDIVKLLIINGYEVAHVAERHITSIQTTELWKYQWSAASIDRIIVNERIMEMDHSFVLLLRNKTRENNCIEHSPLSVYLTEQKGPAESSLRKPEHFRTVLRPLNLILNYIHTSDEPADIIREMGIIYKTEELLQIYYVLLGETISPCSIILGMKYNVYQPNVPDPIDTLRVLWDLAKTREGSIVPLDIEKHIINVIKGECHLDLQLLLSSGIIKNWTWDWIVMSSFLISYNNSLKPLI